jgi:hypothetical protein
MYQSSIEKKSNQLYPSLRYAPGTPRQGSTGLYLQEKGVRGRSFRKKKLIHSRSYGGMQQIPGRAGSSLHTRSQTDRKSDGFRDFSFSSKKIEMTVPNFTYTFDIKNFIFLLFFLISVDSSLL